MYVKDRKITLNDKTKYRYSSHNAVFLWFDNWENLRTIRFRALPRVVRELEKLEKSAEKRERNGNFYTQAASFDVSSSSNRRYAVSDLRMEF